MSAPRRTLGLLLIISLLLFRECDGLVRSPNVGLASQTRRSVGVTMAVGYRNEDERDEQFRLQQEILARRKNPAAKAKALAETEARRKEVTKQATSSMWALNTPSTKDPLEDWKKSKSEGKLQDLGYEETAKNRDLRFSIPLIQSPIDQPAYDNGLRFDLRLPYAERGYEDADSDVMGNISKSFGNLFRAKKTAPQPKVVEPPPPPESPKKKKLFGLF